ncbi:MAG: DNA polymerase III subunit delta [Candidatus Tectimicrobiota bacterium]
MPRVTASALWKRLEEGCIDPCYLLFGEETYLIQEYMTLISERILGSAPRDFNYDVCSLEQTSLDEALSIACTLPVLAAHRVVVLHGLQQLRKADWPALERYLDQPVASTALIGTSTVSDTKKLPPHIWQQAVALECARLEGTRLQNWVVDYIAQRGYRIATDALQFLVHEQQPDLQTIARELEKLCTYMGEVREITLEEVHEITQTSRLQSIFALSDALGARQLGQALLLVERLLNQGEPPLVIFSMIVRHVRLLWSVQQLRSSYQDPPRLAKALGIPPSVCRQLLAQGRHFSVGQLRMLYEATLEADVRFKTSSKSPRSILEEVILQVCGPGVRTG